MVARPAHADPHRWQPKQGGELLPDLSRDNIYSATAKNGTMILIGRLGCSLALPERELAVEGPEPDGIGTAASRIGLLIMLSFPFYRPKSPRL